MNTHRFELSIRKTVGHAALACAASLTIMSVALSAAHAKEIKLGGFHSIGALRERLHERRRHVVEQRRSLRLRQ